MKIELPFVRRLASRLLAIGILPAAAFGFYLFSQINADAATQQTQKNQQQRNQAVNDSAQLPDARQLLVASASNLLNSVPLQAASKLNVNMFDQKIVSYGQYCQMGQGTGFARLEFEFGNKNNPLTILQICHRGLYYRFQSTKKEPELQRVDLRRVVDADRDFLIANQSTWMATGGLSSLMENLAQNFVFETVERSAIGNTPVWRIRGKWNEDRLRRLLYGQVRYSVIQDKINWQELPLQLPHSFEILLGDDEFFPLFPYRISFYQQQKKGNEIESVEIVSMELYEVEKNANISEEKFRADYLGVLPIDLTKNVVERIKNLNQLQRSAEKQPDNQTR